MNLFSRYSRLPSGYYSVHGSRHVASYFVFVFGRTSKHISGDALGLVPSSGQQRFIVGGRDQFQLQYSLINGSLIFSFYLY